MKQEDLERLVKILESVGRAAKLIAEHEASRAFSGINGVKSLFLTLLFNFAKKPADGEAAPNSI